jgi:hypothetical protein
MIYSCTAAGNFVQPTAAPPLRPSESKFRLLRYNSCTAVYIVLLILYVE